MILRSLSYSIKQFARTLKKMVSEDIAVTNFREYLRIRTEQPNPDYAKCKEFLYRIADELKFEKTCYEFISGKPIIVMTIRGTNESLPSLLLYSHTDVVPVVREMWKFDPFAAIKDIDGKIYGRGTQDMKSVGIQYVEALRRLQKMGKKNFLRNVHLVFAPDEEIGGKDGMQKFVDDESFKKLNVGFVLDEGLATEEEAYKVHYGERSPWWVIVKCKGQPGHGSRFIEDTAAEKLQRVINSFLAFREEQKKKLQSDPKLKLGDMITVNLTKVEGGTQVNVVPAELSAWFDIRLPPTVNYDDFEEKVKKWCTDAGKDVTYSFILHTRSNNITPATDDDPWWRTFETVMKEEKCEISKEIFPGSTDSRFLREKGYRSIGFSPMNKTPTLLHDHNEYIEESVFLRGVQIYEKLIARLADLPQYSD
uniref:N-acyl-aliphatic-L-amino acid amidohydrolase n=1 Tax=Ascaris suum TaxID=6253 RepID=F1L6C7_ASCSU